MKKQIYKALMLDIDGTLVPYTIGSLPSQKVAEAVAAASEKVKIVLVTGRSYGSTKAILQALSLKDGYAVINNGANVINTHNQDVIYHMPIDINDAKKAIEILTREEIEFYIKQDIHKTAQDTGSYRGEEVTTPFMIFAMQDYQEDRIDVALADLKKLPFVNAHKVHGKDPRMFGITITHASATKLHGVEKVLEILKIKRADVIGVGDGYNDFPLLMASGLKVAMGNATGDLKEIADYIAPPVEDDGVVDVIEKFVL